MSKKPPIDPEIERWERKYPRYPGVAKCIELLKESNVRGAWVDIICGLLEMHATENAEELITAVKFEVAANSGVARILLLVLADSRLPQATECFAELLDASDSRWHSYAESGLRKLDTKDARRILWEHGVR